MNIYRIFILSLFILLPGKIFSIPAYPFLIKKQQPDGKEINVLLKGDEYIKWMESEDGYSLLYNEDDYIVFAIKNEDGDMIASNMVAQDISSRDADTNHFLEKIPKGLQYSLRQKTFFDQIKIAKEKAELRSAKSPKAAIGNARAICALIEFPDKPFSFSKNDFDQLMNQIGYTNGTQQGSVRDYYLENSYGQLDLTVTIVGPYKASFNYKYYGENDKQGYDLRPHELAREAANFAFNETNINPADYDNDNDGYIDTFHFIFAGHGEESGASKDCIWAHKSYFSQTLKYKDKKLEDYSCSPELKGSSGKDLTYIGVICHELCHVFGAPDFYDADGSSSGGEYPGTGKWDLMATGSWNNGGRKPAHINMYQKIQFGWVNPVILSSPTSIKNMPNSAENPVAYIIESHIPDEYFVLENRQKVKFDSHIPGTGLLIYHVSITDRDIENNTVNTRHPQRVYPIAAHSPHAQPSSSSVSYGSINSAYTPFPSSGIHFNPEFSDTSIPASLLWNGEKLGKPIFNIKQENNLISFNFYKELYKLNLNASLEGNKVTLTWEAPITEKKIEGYNIYRDTELIQFMTGLLYRENLSSEGTYTYGVAVKFENEESALEETQVIYNISGLNKIKVSSIEIYPTSIKKGNTLTIRLVNNGIKGTFSLYSLSGQLLFSKEINSPEYLHSINYPAGIYLVKVQQGQSFLHSKLIIR